MYSDEDADIFGPNMLFFLEIMQAEIASIRA